MGNKLKYGMVGGGPGAFIGDAHRKAIHLDSTAVLTAGCFSRTPEKTKAQGEALGISSDRCYATYGEMAEKEAAREDGKQGAWRCDPAQSGKVNCLGDLGTHVENAVASMTGLKVKRVLAKMDVVVPGRVLDDNDQILVEYDNGATGVNWTSQFAIGCDNSLRVRIYGSKGTILWFQERCEEVTLIREDGISQVIRRGNGAITPTAGKYSRLPAGHTEGWLESMGNLYDSFAECVEAKKQGTFEQGMIDYPTIEEGIAGLKYVEACLESNEKGNIWVEL